MNLYSIETIHLKTLKEKKKMEQTYLYNYNNQKKKKSPNEKFESEKWRRCTITGQFGFIGLKQQRSYKKRGRQINVKDKSGIKM